MWELGSGDGPRLGQTHSGGMRLPAPPRAPEPRRAAVLATAPAQHCAAEAPSLRNGLSVRPHLEIYACDSHLCIYSS